MRWAQRGLLEAARRAARTAAAESPSCSACSLPRAATGALASASPYSASTAAAALAARSTLLHSLPARLRGALRAEHLEAAMAEVAQLRARQVAAAGRQMDAARIRIAALQRELRWDRVEALVASRLAPQLCNALSLSKAGQRLLLVGAPLTLSWYLSEPAHCYDAGAGTLPPPRVLVTQQRQHLLQRLADNIADEVAMMCRAIYLLVLFMPAAFLAPLCVTLGWRRRDWLLLVRWTLERAGPAFIKWGQWAATRPDMFPTDMCDVLASLQTAAPRHAFKHTRRTIEAAFRQPLEEIFEDFSRTPVASGSIAQIHKATLSARGAARTKFEPGCVVAVKVRHPGVDATMQRDFALMQRAALLSTRVPFLAQLNLEESVRQFGAPLREQLDLQSEARNLARFNANFRTSKRVSFPKPIFPLVAPDVLVESFEDGDLISRYVEDPQNKHNEALADIGLESYLKMLLFDRFFHADLHPGNILVRVDDDSGPWSFLEYLKSRISRRSPEHLVLLDVGMVAELTPDDQLKFVDFFKAITDKDGAALGKNVLRFAHDETCERPEEFIGDMKALFDSLTWEQISDDTGGVIQEMMETIRRHQVNLRGVVSTVVVTTLVLEGWSSKLNPDLQMLAKLKSLLPATWPERINKYISDFGSDRAVEGAVIEV